MSGTVTCLVGPRAESQEGRLSRDEFVLLCQELSQRRLFRPFAPELLEFCAKLSQRLVKHERAREFPQIVSLGFWLRPAAILKLSQNYLGVDQDVIRVPRGLAFHLPPANVDTLFVYSWLLSTLAGNPNIVRLPTELNQVARLLIEAIADVASPELLSTNAFVSFERDDSLTEIASRHCAVRVVWGGDEKVRHIRGVPLPPNATELTFANRFSIAAVETLAYANLSDAGVREVAEKFYNDVYWFDQMGCSSPRVVYWIGERNRYLQHRERFYRALEETAARKAYRVDVATSVAKLSHAHRSVLDSGVTRHHRFGPAVTVLDLPEPTDVRADVQGGGVVYDAYVDDLRQLVPQLRREDQTLSVFGFSKDELMAFARAANGRGIDRIVPMGQALDFGHIWDGWDLPAAFTRCVRIAQAGS